MAEDTNVPAMKRAMDNKIVDPMDDPDQSAADKHVLKELLRKVRACPSYSSLFDLQPLFNQNGLTLQVTTKNRMIMCKIMEGKPYCKNVIDDYMFIGSLKDSDHEVSDRMRECVVDFILNSASGPAVITDGRRDWQDRTRLYGNKIGIVREEIQRIAQDTRILNG